MADIHDEYKRLDIPAGVTLHECPVCHSDAELWQYSKSATGPATKAVMCANGEAIGPQAGAMSEGCLLFMPPDEFYCATIREAAKYWNEYAKALGIISRKNSWKRHSALRETEGESNG